MSISMDFFKLKKFRNPPRRNANDVTEELSPVPQPEQVETGPTDLLGKSVNVEPNYNTEMEDDEDDFIMDEINRKLKDLRRNSCLGSIPEEPNNEDEEQEEEQQEEQEGDGQTITNEWRDVEAEGQQFWSGFDAVYEVYCESMLFFDRFISQQLLEAGSHLHYSAPSSRSASKKLPSPLRCLYLKKHNSPKEETEQLQKPIKDLSQDLETVYVAQMCLTWEALHCQYSLFIQKVSNQPGTTTSYNHSAQHFQQFQVLLQRFIENEPFEAGSRPEIYARSRKAFPNLLQVPKIQGFDERTGNDASYVVLASDLTKIIESSILSFRQFIKKEKRKPNGARILCGFQSHKSMPVQQVQFSLQKKVTRLKEMWKKSKSYKRKSWPNSSEEGEMLLGLIDVKLMSRVLRMSTISNDQLLWCEEKMRRLSFSDDQLQRDPSPILFPF